jgi:uncharacterized integral membrane protein (TIGR00697 family)
MDRKGVAVPVLVALYVACELIANVTASKITVFGRWTVPAAIYIFALTFTLIDLINRTMGPRGARQVILGSVLANILLALYVRFAIALPPAPFYGGQEAYEATLGSTPRIVFASLLAYFVASNVDVVLFARLVGRVAPWGRVLSSNAVSLALDTLIFIPLAFAFTGVALIDLVIGQYLAKMAITLVSIPLIYVVHDRPKVDAVPA